MNASQRATAEGILFTDLYQLTMSQVYFRYGLHENQAQFDHFFRSYPDYGEHQAGYCINAGLEWLLDWMERVRFRDEDVAYLKTQKGANGDRIFDDDFLDWLKKHEPWRGLSINAIPEGRVVHPNVPLTTVRGPMIGAQILETQLLNQLNYQTLIATKAARVQHAGRGRLMLEFGARRAHGSAANAGARAALIGGADFTSNTGVSYAIGYPPKGTHAHSMVQAFMALGMGELEAFRAYADVYPDDCLLLVDTINTLESGIPNAIKVFEELRQKGHKPSGIRLDSGDLAYLAVQSARMLNDAGFPDVSIVLSSNLDELVLLQIIAQIQEEAKFYDLDPDSVIDRLVYGVGTRLITSAGDSALDGVYKLVAIEDEDKNWKPAIKISENSEKIPNPGDKKVWRMYDQRERAVVDLMSLRDEDPNTMNEIRVHHPVETSKSNVYRNGHISKIEALQVEVMRDGQIVFDRPTIEDMRNLRRADLDALDSGVRRIMNPHIYHVSLTDKLWKMKQDLIESTTNNHG